MTKDTRFKSLATNPDHVQGHLKGAHKKLKAAQKIAADDAEAAYQLAYEAMLKASLALILQAGLRPRSQAGHHIAIIEKAGMLLGKDAKDLIVLFDNMRRNRNAFLYEPDGFISEYESQTALKVARRYLKLITSAISEL